MTLVEQLRPLGSNCEAKVCFERSDNAQLGLSLDDLLQLLKNLSHASSIRLGSG